MTKIWVVKHALSAKGIFEIDGEIEPNGFVSYIGKRGHREYLHGEGREWCPTKASAMATAEIMRRKAIDEHDRALGRLHSLVFGEVAHG